MSVYKHNIFYFIKHKSFYITFIVLFCLTLISNIFLAVSLDIKYSDSNIVYFWFSYTLILLQIIIINIQIFIIVINEQKKLGIIDLEIRKGIKKQFTFIYRILASFTITLSIFLINLFFYYLIVLPFAIISVVNIGLFVWGILTIILFDIVFKTFMTLFSVMKKNSLGVSLGTIFGILLLFNPLVAASITIPMTANSFPISDYYNPNVDFNILYIDSELMEIGNNYEGGIVNSYVKTFTQLANYENLPKAKDVGEKLFLSQTSVECGENFSNCLNSDGSGVDDTKRNLAAAENKFIDEEIFYLNTILGIDTSLIIQMVNNNLFPGITLNTSTQNLKNIRYEFYLKNNFLNNFYNNILDPVESNSDYSNFWNNIFSSNNSFDKNYVYKNFNKALKSIENKINYENKQEWIKIEPILKTYFFNVVIYSGTFVYNDKSFYDSAIYKFNSSVNLNFNDISKQLKEVNPFICAIRSMLYNIFSYIYVYPLGESSKTLLSKFPISNNNNNNYSDSIADKNEWLENWSNYFNKNSKKYYLNPFIIYSSFMYNQSPIFLDRAYANFADTISYQINKGYINPYGPIHIHINENTGQIDEISIQHKLYYINALAWIMPIIISAGFIILVGFIFTKKIVI